jgi:hypothetical protein
MTAYTCGSTRSMHSTFKFYDTLVSDSSVKFSQRVQHIKYWLFEY